MTVDLEELKQKEALEKLMADREAPPELVTTAVLLVQDLNGQWVAYHDFADRKLSLERQATFDDIVGGCAVISAGCQVQQTAIATMITMEQRAAQMQQQFAQQQEANRVASLIDPKKLRV